MAVAPPLASSAAGIAAMPSRCAHHRGVSNLRRRQPNSEARTRPQCSWVKASKMALSHPDLRLRVLIGATGKRAAKAWCHTQGAKASSKERALRALEDEQQSRVNASAGQASGREHTRTGSAAATAAPQRQSGPAPKSAHALSVQLHAHPHSLNANLLTRSVIQQSASAPCSSQSLQHIVLLETPVGGSSVRRRYRHHVGPKAWLFIYNKKIKLKTPILQ